ncbi:hypothetical protein [Streptomyces sp. NPDC014894]|uniref:hypothetical protein n=1 Tax=Streptomyces sp. NPDC014894 TaxID=3364931 RepID=UPI0036FA9AB0
MTETNSGRDPFAWYLGGFACLVGLAGALSAGLGVAGWIHLGSERTLRGGYTIGDGPGSEYYSPAFAIGFVWLIGLFAVVIAKLGEGKHVPRAVLFPALVTTALGLVAGAVHLMTLGQEARHIWGASCLAAVGLLLPVLLRRRDRSVQRRLRERRARAAQRAEQQRRRRERRERGRPR